MSRRVEFHENQLVLHLTGLTSFAALKRELEIPYSTIKNIQVDTFTISPFTFRVGTSTIGQGIREGRFLQNGKWIFLSYENNQQVVILDLQGHEYAKVVFEVENPELVKKSIEERIQK